MGRINAHYFLYIVFCMSYEVYWLLGTWSRTATVTLVGSSVGIAGSMCVRTPCVRTACAPFELDIVTSAQEVSPPVAGSTR